jgi:hypothetical protein
VTAPPVPFGSYPPDDVTFLLKDLSGVALERDLEDREEAIQSGLHYSEMLPVEYRPTPAYLALFEEALAASARRVALGVAVAAERVRRRRAGEDLVLVSLARAGTPAGILVRRYLRDHADLDAPHYSMSIIRGRGIDEVALDWLRRRHATARLQFVDAWTGKGAIQRELTAAVGSPAGGEAEAPAGGEAGAPAGGEAKVVVAGRFGPLVDDQLAVVADPGRCAAIWGTRDDFLLPSACLNATVSGLVSRTVLNAALIGPGDFHGAKWYRELAGDDVSNRLVDTIAAELAGVAGEARRRAAALERAAEPADWAGAAEVSRLAGEYGITDTNLVKPGVGETVRVLLRRVPWMVLVHPDRRLDLAPVLALADERGVPVEERPDLAYSCVGLIKQLTTEHP